MPASAPEARKHTAADHKRMQNIPHWLTLTSWASLVSLLAIACTSEHGEPGIPGMWLSRDNEHVFSNTRIKTPDLRGGPLGCTEAVLYRWEQTRWFSRAFSSSSSFIHITNQVEIAVAGTALRPFQSVPGYWLTFIVTCRSVDQYLWIISRLLPCRVEPCFLSY